jgi:hypothetical protein
MKLPAPPLPLLSPLLLKLLMPAEPLGAAQLQ